MSEPQPVKVDTAGAVNVVGHIWPPDDPVYVTTDMFHCNIPTRLGPVSIDVSWEPDSDPDGEYIATAYKGSWGNRLAQMDTKDPCKVARWVEQHIKHWSNPESFRMGRPVLTPEIVATMNCPFPHSEPDL